MKTWFRKITRPRVTKKPYGKGQLILLLLLLLLLPALAVMQYFWLGQLSQAERVRLYTNLELSAKRFAEDFDKELTRIHEAFKLEADPEIDISTNISNTYRNWFQNASLPDLIKEIYLLDFTEHTPVLKLFNKDTGKLKATEWPEDLSELKKMMPDSSTVIAPMLISLTHAPIFGKVPLLLTECLTCGPEQDNLARMPDMDFNYLVLVLDANVIKGKFIPVLAERYFPSADDTQFDLAIAAIGDSAKVFYISRPELAINEFEKADIRTEIGKWRSNNFLFARASIVELDSGITKIEKKIENRRMSIEVIRADSIKEKQLYRFMIGRTAKWELFVTYRQGSLENIVNATRNRNLLISYSILLLLGISITMVFISSRRAKILAAKQMQFVAGISHELRTPLSVIRSAGENLADGVELNPDQLKKYGQLIRDEGKRLTTMVDKALTFSGIQNDNKQYQFEPVSIIELLEESIQTVLNSLSSQYPEIARNIDSQIPKLHADAAALKTAFENIISNAVKYSPLDRGIRIEAHFEEKEEKIIVRFEDQGWGIDAEDIPHVFEPFYRGKNNDAGQIPGTGLGLSIVKEIIELHGGELLVESEPGKGSIFIVSLPVPNNYGSTSNKGNRNE